jgi:hypothetical protein
VNSIYRRDEHGPHGKNLTEGFEDEGRLKDGTALAFKAEVGSKNDPARLAEEKFGLNKASGGRNTGPRQGGVDRDSAFAGLNSTEDA